MVSFSPHLHGWIETLLYLCSRGEVLGIPLAERRALEELVPDHRDIQRPQFALYDEVSAPHDEIDSWFNQADWQTRFLIIAGEQSRLLGGAGEGFSVPADKAPLLEKYAQWFAQILRDHLTPGDDYYLTVRNLSDPVIREVQENPHSLIIVDPAIESGQWWTTPNYLRPQSWSLTYSRRFVPATGWLSVLTSAELFMEDTTYGIVEDLIEGKQSVDAEVAGRRGRLWGKDMWDRPDRLPIYTVNSGSDFADLVARFPQVIPPNTRHTLRDPHTVGVRIDVIPDWSQIAQHYSGVFVSAEAFLRDTWLPLQTPHGLTVMTNWAPETLYRIR